MDNPSSVIHYKKCKYLMFDSPNEHNLELYLHEMKKYNIKDIVRACEPTYPIEKFKEAGITVHVRCNSKIDEELSFEDGGVPPDKVVKDWLKLCKETFQEEGACLGIHCVAGLGRTPVLVGVGLIEEGMKYSDAVSLIRSQRKGALNYKQLKWLKAYKPHKDCAIM